MRKRGNKKVLVLREDGGINSPLLTGMRETVFGSDASVALYDQAERSARMRNDQALLEAAQLKRQRKAAKALKVSK